MKSPALFRLASCVVLLVSAHTTAHTQAAAPHPTSEPQATGSPSPSPSDEHDHVRSLERDFVKNIFRDQAYFWTYPARMQGRDAIWIVPFAGSTAALIATDRRTSNAVKDSPARIRTSRDIGRASVFAMYGTAGLFYAIGHATGNDRARETGVLAAEAMIGGGLIVQGLKYATQRDRPTSGDGSGKFWARGNSFPSGHAVQTWSLATIVAYEYQDKRAVQVAAYALAASVSISRYTARRHFLSDILVGSAIGYGVGRYIYKKSHSAGGRSTGGGASRAWPVISPAFSARSRGFQVAMHWSF